MGQEVSEKLNPHFSSSHTIGLLIHLYSSCASAPTKAIENTCVCVCSTSGDVPAARMSVRVFPSPIPIRVG